jgi:phenylacetate-CoA ligase
MSGLYTRLISGLIFPLHERLKGHDTHRLLGKMEQSQWWSPEKLAELQLQRLRELLVSAGEQVPYYRELFELQGFRPAALERLEQLQELPFLTKDIIRANQERLMAADASHTLSRFNTGGSSGEPLIFYIGKERISHDVAAKWRATRWWGVDIGDPEIVIWGSPIELGAQDYIKALRDRLLRTHLLPAFEMSDARLEQFLVKIRSIRPGMLFGYPSALAHIARYALSRGIRMDNLGVRVAFVTSESLYEDQRGIIEKVFNCRVANGYGGRDAGFIAHECPAGGLHITAEDIIVEITDGAGQVLPPGQAGEVVVTHLATAGFPFIRYRTGDVAVLDDQSCSCGRGLPMLKEIHGRTTDFVVATDGTVMHGLALIYIIRDLPGVQKFKVVQEDLQLTRILIVTGPEFRESDLETIRTGVRQRLGEDVEVAIERVAEIPAERSGKYRYVVSHVQTATDVTEDKTVAG